MSTADNSYAICLFRVYVSVFVHCFVFTTVRVLSLNREMLCVAEFVSFRPAIFDRERDLEHQKNLYVHSVTRHMKEHQGSNKGTKTCIGFFYIAML